MVGLLLLLLQRERWGGLVWEVVVLFGRGGAFVEDGEGDRTAHGGGGGGGRGGGRGRGRKGSLVAVAAAAARPASVLLLGVLLLRRRRQRHRRRLLLLLLRRGHGVERMHGGKHLLGVWLRTTLGESLLVVHGMLVIPLGAFVSLHILRWWRRRHTCG